VLATQMPVLASHFWQAPQAPQAHCAPTQLELAQTCPQLPQF
jgi:hypothetical protein